MKPRLFRFTVPVLTSKAHLQFGVCEAGTLNLFVSSRTELDAFKRASGMLAGLPYLAKGDIDLSGPAPSGWHELVAIAERLGTWVIFEDAIGSDRGWSGHSVPSLWRVTAKVTLTPDHPSYFDFGNAVATIWISDQSENQACVRARMILNSQSLILEPTICITDTPHKDAATDASNKYYAQHHGVSFDLFGVQPGDTQERTSKICCRRPAARRQRPCS